MGCPSGIGPEVSVKAALALEKADPGARVLVVGSVDAARAGARAMKIDEAAIVRVEDPTDAWSRRSRGTVLVYEPTAPLAAVDRRPGHPTKKGGAAQLAWIDVATDLVTSGRADALVTGPVSKKAIASSGAPNAASFRGHTEHLGERLGAPDTTMAFYSRGLVSTLVTTHLPHAAVARAITKASVARAILHTAWLTNLLESDAHRACIAVASLNPHAGEGGLLGREEITAIGPAVESARAKMKAAKLRGDVEGPIGAETAFRRAQDGWFSAVVAMYHDQATIPMKMATFGEAVNVTLGLPIVRTSVDHGTAYDAAGKGTADASGMLEAMQLAATLERRWHGPPRLSGGAGTSSTRAGSRR
ncbi:MAG: 4-hydroxythreonine-4-phosphate dehydrogenase PdxA [Deltaproteobacteria bacterium]|nr:4-hydroxythreonine-4-phosphate dehydrogenase PdxA [Deltaproteobacteria bacterium]